MRANSRIASRPSRRASVIAAAKLYVVGAEFDARAVAAEAAELMGDLADANGYVLADGLATQVAGLADSLDALAAALASSAQTVPSLRALPSAS
jgi:hypothetical protein